MAVENVNDYLNDLLSNTAPLTSNLREDAENIAKQVMSMIAEKDDRFQCFVIGTGSCFEGTLVPSSDFDFDFMIVLEKCTKFVVDEFLGKCGFVKLKFIDQVFSEEDLMCLVDGGRVLDDYSKENWTKKGLFAQLVEDVLPSVNLPFNWNFRKTRKVEDNGPAVTICFLNENSEKELKLNVSIDLVLAIQLPYLPGQVDLLHRLPKEHPLYMQLTDLIKTCACYVVLKRISFRISFSVMENKLFETFPFLHDIYKIVKILRNRFLKDNQGNKLLSSYELKTAVFFELECYPNPIMWNKSHTIDRVQNIFAFILDGLFREEMSHFFISHKNIFESEDSWFILNSPKHWESNTRNTPLFNLTLKNEINKRIHFVMELFYALSKDKWDCKKNIKIIKTAERDAADNEYWCFGKGDVIAMQLSDINSWRLLQTELLRIQSIGKLTRKRMVKIMINRSTGVQRLGYLKYDFIPSRWIAHSDQFTPGKVFQFGLHFTPTLLVTKDVTDKVSLDLTSVLSAIPRPDATKIKDADYEIRSSDKKDSTGAGKVNFRARKDTSFYWSHFVEWEEGQWNIVGSNKVMMTIPVVYYN